MSCPAYSGAYATALALVGLLMPCSQTASAQRIIAGTRSDLALATAVVLSALPPIGEALLYRLAIGVAFKWALFLCAILDPAAYGATVIWVHFLPGGASPWFGRLIAPAESHYSRPEAAIGAILYLGLFLAVKVPALSWWPTREADRRTVSIVTLANLVLFFAVSAAMGPVVSRFFSRPNHAACPTNGDGESQCPRAMSRS